MAASLTGSVINFILFSSILIFCSFLLESAQRRLFSLRDQLKLQYRTTQRAQQAERVASESKRRFVSYIFHEIRVPLNASMLALANLEGEKVFADLSSADHEMVSGLTSSML